MFNNCNSKTNGEYLFYMKIKDSLQVFIQYLIDIYPKHALLHAFIYLILYLASREYLQICDL